MKTADLDYYRNVANTQNNQDILKAELFDLIDEVEVERKEIISLIDEMIEKIENSDGYKCGLGNYVQLCGKLQALTELKQKIEGE